ncbi:MAG: hypothetical protein NZL95_05780, partial [Chitinophagales bacterium]|nr:hypothetical protein [Chitinophagales bacterium]MDW8428044.1 hypothetical protein [Chitinophagales bacterium]
AAAAAAAQMLAAFRYFHFRLHTSLVARLATYTVGCIMVFLLLYHTHVHFLVALPSGGLLCLTLGYALRLLQPADWWPLSRSA